MKRRSFLAAALLPTAAAAQQPPPLIGILRAGGRADEQFESVFRHDMTRLGWEDGKTYRTQFLFADGDSSRLPALAAELVKAGPKVLVAFGNAGAAAMQAATKDIPIVVMADDLLAWGVVASMARPGGHVAR